MVGGDPAWAVDWTGGTGDFGTAGNWNSGSGPVPGSGDTATVSSGTVSVTSSHTLGTIDIGGTGKVNITTGSLLATSLKVTTGGTLDIASGRTLTATTTTLSGTVQGDGTLSGGAITQTGGTLNLDHVTATTYVLKTTGQITGGEVSFSDSFSLQGASGKVASGVELTGDGSATMSHSGAGTEMAGIVTGVTSYTQDGGTMSEDGSFVFQ